MIIVFFPVEYLTETVTYGSEGSDISILATVGEGIITILKNQTDFRVRFVKIHTAKPLIDRRLKFNVEKVRMSCILFQTEFLRRVIGIVQIIIPMFVAIPRIFIFCHQTAIDINIIRVFKRAGRFISTVKIESSLSLDRGTLGFEPELLIR